MINELVKEKDAVNELVKNEITEMKEVFGLEDLRINFYDSINFENSLDIDLKLSTNDGNTAEAYFRIDYDDRAWLEDSLDWHIDEYERYVLFYSELVNALRTIREKAFGE